VADLAKKYQTSEEQVQQHLNTGIKVEMEHTHDPRVAQEIALDHLGERLDYYQQLAKIEMNEAISQFDIVWDPKAADLKTLARRSQYRTARFVIYKPDERGNVKSVAGDADYHTHHSMAPGQGRWAVRGFVQWRGGNKYIHRSMDPNGPQNARHYLLHDWERDGIDNGNPTIIENSDLEESVTLSDGTRVAKNLSVDRLLDMARHGHSVRGLIVGQDILWWPGQSAIHKDVADLLGLKDYGPNRLILYPHGNTFVLDGKPFQQWNWKSYLADTPRLQQLVNDPRLSIHEIGSSSPIAAPKWLKKIFGMHEDTTRSSESGAPGTLKAKITRMYGGKVTCAKTERLKRRQGATAHDKAQANWFQNKHCGGASKVEESQIPSEVEWPTQLAWTIQFKRFKDLEPLLDVRANKIYLMPFENWERTYYSLTNKDLHKVKFMPTRVYRVDPSALVGDMAIINRAMRAQNDNDKQQALDDYQNSLVTYEEFAKNPSMFRMPEILATADQIHDQNQKIAGVVSTTGKKFRLSVLNRLDKTEPNSSKVALSELFNQPARQLVWRKRGLGESQFFSTNFRFDDKNIVVEMHPDVHQVGAKYVFNNREVDLPWHYQGYLVIFRTGIDTDITGEMGTKAAALFSTVTSVIQGFLTDHEWNYVLFSGAEGSRNKLYQSLSQRLASQLNLEYLSYGNDFVIYKPMLEEAGGVGLVVPGVNMPAGMHPDEIARQARKFGFKVSKQGVPPVARSDGKL
jgi:ribulose bisphosphate carboxylase small subunit